MDICKLSAFFSHFSETTGLPTTTNRVGASLYAWQTDTNNDLTQKLIMVYIYFLIEIEYI